jgi:Protein of unknown function (DUF2889)
VEINAVSPGKNERSHACALSNKTNAEKGAELSCTPGSADVESAKNVCLYRKEKDVAIYLTEKKQLCVEVRLIDPRHRMSCMVTFSQPHLIIEDVQSRMEKYPHADCIRAVSSLEVMIGKSVQPGILQAAAKSIKSSACTHLLDLFREACYSVIQGQGLYLKQILEELHPNLNIEQIAKVLFTLNQGLLDSCVSYQKGSKFSKMLENTPFPLDPEQFKAFQSICRSK